MTIFEFLMGIVQDVINLAKAFDVWMGLSIWQLFIMFIGMLDMIWIVSALFNGGGASD